MVCIEVGKCYRVAISDREYYKLKSFEEWCDDHGFVGDYNEYIDMHRCSELEYCITVSTDVLLEDLPVQLYDRVYGSDTRVSGSSARFRIFHFRSEVHFTWFVMRFL